MEEKKKIIFNNNIVKYMTFEEVREYFIPILLYQIRKTNNKFTFNKVEEEDFMQELQIELWRAYIQYEPQLGNCFGTFLYYKLQKGVRNVTYSKFSVKNLNNGILPLNAPLNVKNNPDEKISLEDILPSNNESVEEELEFKELLKLIYQFINTKEEKELMIVLLYKREYSVQKYADIHKITRQAANQRISKLRKKLQKIIIQKYFC